MSPLGARSPYEACGWEKHLCAGAALLSSWCIKRGLRPRQPALTGNGGTTMWPRAEATIGRLPPRCACGWRDIHLKSSVKEGECGFRDTAGSAGQLRQVSVSTWRLRLRVHQWLSTQFDSHVLRGESNHERRLPVGAGSRGQPRERTRAAPAFTFRGCMAWRARGTLKGKGGQPSPIARIEIDDELFPILVIDLEFGRNTQRRAPSHGAPRRIRHGPKQRVGRRVRSAELAFLSAFRASAAARLAQARACPERRGALGQR